MIELVSLKELMLTTSPCCKKVIDKSSFRSSQAQQLYTIFHKLNCKSKVQYVGKAEIAFNIRLNNHRKYVNNPKSVPADFHFIKPGHSFNLHAKFTLIEQLSNFYTTEKDTLKFRSKRVKTSGLKNLKC